MPTTLSTSMAALNLLLASTLKKACIYWDKEGRPSDSKHLQDVFDARIGADILSRDYRITIINEDDSVKSEILAKASNAFSRKIATLDKRFGIELCITDEERLNHFLKVIEHRYLLNLIDTRNNRVLASMLIPEAESRYAECIAIMFEEALGTEDTN